MSRAEVLEYINSVKAAVSQPKDTAEETSVVREEPPEQ
jgi:hypothetical protein